jgi:hypothetical protein
VALTPAERKRRSRAHQRGDHSLCDPSRICVTYGDAPSHPVTSPVGLAPRGRQLWRELAKDLRTPAQRVLLEEACRIADRLEQLDRLLRGESATWLRLVEDIDTGEVTVVVDKALAEARQQQLALSRLMAEIRQSGAAGAATPQPTQGVSFRDDLRARREARLANAAGR